MTTRTSARRIELSRPPARAPWFDLPFLGPVSTLVWAAAVVVAAVAFGFGGGPYVQSLIGIGGAFVVSAVGYNIVLGYAGQLAFGHSGFMAIGAYTYAVLRDHDVPLSLAVVAGLILPALFAVVVGFSALKVSHLYLALITLAFAQAIAVIISVMPITGRTDGIPVDVAGSYAWLVAVLSALAVILSTDRIIRSRVGRAMAMVREDEDAAAAMGVPRTYIKVLAFALSGVFGGAGGILLGGVLNYITPQNFNVQVTLFALTMLVVGGLGSLVGTVAGVGLLVYVQYGLQVPPGYLNIIYGVILLVVIVAFPGGLVSLPHRVHSVLSKLRRRTAR